MFWSKTKPATPSVVPPHDPSALEKGKETDRRSSFSSADSSPQSSPIKTLPTSLPQLPKATYTASRPHSQTQSVDEHTSAGQESFTVLSNAHGNRNGRSRLNGLMRRYWFIAVLALLVTITIIGAMAAVMAKNKNAGSTAYYFSPENTTNKLGATSYWIIGTDGTIIHNPFDAPTATPTPTAS